MNLKVFLVASHVPEWYCATALGCAETGSRDVVSRGYTVF